MNNSKIFQLSLKDQLEKNPNLVLTTLLHPFFCSSHQPQPKKGRKNILMCINVFKNLKNQRHLQKISGLIIVLSKNRH